MEDSYASYKMSKGALLKMWLEMTHEHYTMMLDIYRQSLINGEIWDNEKLKAEIEEAKEEFQMALVKFKISMNIHPDYLWGFAASRNWVKANFGDDESYQKFRKKYCDKLGRFKNTPKSDDNKDFESVYRLYDNAIGKNDTTKPDTKRCPLYSEYPPQENCTEN